MELLEKYTYTVYVLGSFSAASKELFISQPALSAAIARHEKNLGFTVFDRSVIPVSLTPEGKIYIEYLEQKERGENEMRMRIKMLYDVSYGAIAIGAYSFSASEVLANICGQFNQKYPNVKVRVDMGNIGKIENLSEKMRNHALDMMISYDFDKNECVGVPILKEQMIVAMHKDMPGAKELIPLSVSKEKITNGEICESDYITDLSVFKDVRFFEYAPFSNTLYKMKQIFGEFQRTNYTVENARQINMHNKLMKQKIGAVMTTDFHIKTNEFDDDNIIYFVPKSEFSQRILYIITLKDVILNPAAKKFLELAAEIYK